MILKFEMTYLLPLVIGAAVLWIVFRFVRNQFRHQDIPEAVEGSTPADPFARVPSPKKNAPRSRAGAVALEEPEEDEYLPIHRDSIERILLCPAAHWWIASRRCVTL